MEKLFRYSAVVLAIISLLAYLDWTHAQSDMSWAFVPSMLLIWIAALASTVLSIIAFIYWTNKKMKISSFITPILTLGFTIYLVVPLLQDMTTKEELIHTTESPYGTFKIEFYKVSGGKSDLERVLGKLDGPLWFKKNIYLEKAQNEVTTNWIDDNIIIINEKTLNLATRETYPQPEKKKNN